MRLLFLAPANSVHSARWIRWFAEAGHEVTWISAHPADVEIPANITLHVLPPGNPVTRWPRWLLAVRRIVRTARPDVVQVHSLGTYALLAFGVATDIPLVSTPWGSDIILDAKGWLRRRIVTRTLQRSALCTCDAQHMRPRLAEFGVAPERVHIINFGIEAERFEPIATARFAVVPGQAAGAAASAGTTSSAVISRMRVVSLRNLDPVYDIPTLIRAAALVKQAQIPLAVEIFGAGPLRDALETQIREGGLSTTVALRGRYSHATLPSILSEADLYVSTSTSDAGIAASTAEAMAAGLPAIISDSGENAAWISDDVNGRLFPVGDAERLAQIIIEAAGNPVRRMAWAKAGMRTILDRNDYQSEMRKMEALYVDAAGSRRGD